MTEITGRELATVQRFGRETHLSLNRFNGGPMYLLEVRSGDMSWALHLDQDGVDQIRAMFEKFTAETVTS